jgi:hypothetical protein
VKRSDMEILKAIGKDIAQDDMERYLLMIRDVYDLGYQDGYNAGMADATRKVSPDAENFSNQKGDR